MIQSPRERAAHFSMAGPHFVERKGQRHVPCPPNCRFDRRLWVPDQWFILHGVFLVSVKGMLTPRRCRQCKLGVAKPPELGGTEWRAMSVRQGRGDGFGCILI